jgi:hypothetical protein
MSVESPIAPSAHWFQGEDRELIFQILDSAGTPVNMTGWTLRWMLFSGATGGSTLISKAGVAFDNAATNDAARVTIEDTDTISALGAELVAPGSYWHELWKTNEGDEQLLAFGTARLQASGRRQTA